MEHVQLTGDIGSFRLYLKVPLLRVFVELGGYSMLDWTAEGMSYL